MNWTIISIVFGVATTLGTAFYLYGRQTAIQDEKWKSHEVTHERSELLDRDFLTDLRREMEGRAKTTQERTETARRSLEGRIERAIARDKPEDARQDAKIEALEKRMDMLEMRCHGAP